MDQEHTGNGARHRDLLPFPSEVYRQRLESIQAELESRRLAGMLLFDPENIFWLTGYQTIGYFTFQALFVGGDGDPVVIGRIVNRDLALAHATIGDFVAVVDTADPIDVLSDWLNARLQSGQRIGLETSSANLRVDDYRRLTRLAAADLADCNGLIEPHRMIKSSAEIECLQQASRCAEAGLAAAIDAIAPGKTENDIAAAMFEANIRSGSEYLGHPPLVVAGETTGLCFAMWRRREIRRGDVVLLEAAGCINRYHSIMSRPVVVGPPTRRQRDAADALQAVLESAIDNIKPGLTSGEVDAACRAEVERRGLGEYFRHRAAYGIGIGFPPNWSEGHIYAIGPRDPLVLQPNMTFHVIPTLFLDDFGMCFSDSLRVTESGCELLTRFERKLFVIET